MVFITALIALLGGLVVLVKSADVFVEGAAALAKVLGMSPLLIGMVVIGFGTSAPEMLVSVLSALSGNPGIALGNAYGSNISNIALILGFTALFYPIRVQGSVMRLEMPLLAFATFLTGYLIYDGNLEFYEGVLHLVVFALIFGGTIWWSIKKGQGTDDDQEEIADLTTKQSIMRTFLGLVFLTISSRVLIWGGVTLAGALGVGDVLIGLTIVAIGTSLPELASTLAASKKGQDDLAVGNIIGSNMFNTLAVIGLATVFHPMEVDEKMFTRDWPLMVILTLGLFVIGYRRGKPRLIGKFQGAALVTIYVSYTLFLIWTELISKS